MAFAQTEETSSIVRLLADSPAAKAALAAREAERTMARRGLIAQVKALDRAHEKRRPHLEAEIGTALAALKEVEAALLAAQRRANAAIGAKSGAAGSYTVQRN